ncbi:MAG: hypothetical protein AMXMBFR7_43700 [Planctomycetota bacterium]
MDLRFHWQMGKAEGTLAKGLLADLRMAQSIEICVAWITDGPILEELRRAGRRGTEIILRVGLGGFVTDPRALKTLLRAPNTQVRVWETSQGSLFHPKVYLCEQKRQRSIWIGSNNATRSALEANCEAASCVANPDPAFLLQVRSFFSEIEARCVPLSTAILERYTKKYTKAAEAQRRAEAAARARLKTVAKAKRSQVGGHWFTMTWPEYFRALKSQSRATGEHRDRDKDWSVLRTPKDSYLSTIEDTAKVLRSRGRNISRFDCQKIVGDHASKGEEWWEYGHLGTMTASGKTKNGVLENTRGMRDRILDICRDRTFWKDRESSVSGVAALWKIPRVGPGLASRIGAILRPDLLVSINNAAVERLAKETGIPAGRIRSDWHGYRELLEVIWQAPWMNETTKAKPGSLEHRCWKARCALIDMFAYMHAPEFKSGR